jgi:hypothetical protein
MYDVQYMYSYVHMISVSQSLSLFDSTAPQFYLFIYFAVHTYVQKCTYYKYCMYTRKVCFSHCDVSTEQYIPNCRLPIIKRPYCLHLCLSTCLLFPPSLYIPVYLAVSVCSLCTCLAGLLSTCPHALHLSYLSVPSLCHAVIILLIITCLSAWICLWDLAHLPVTLFLAGPVAHWLS